jgi:arylsulfatase A-like enzyme
MRSIGSAWRAVRRAPVRVVATCALAVVGGCQWGTPSPANLILVTIDTLRADHLGVYGYARDTSPNLDAMARAGTWFPRCYTQSTTTRASHATIFTGTHQRTHGVPSNVEEFPDRPSIMTALRARGYATAGFVSSVVLNRKFGIQKQLDHFDDAATSAEVNRPKMAERPARDTLRAAVRYLESRDAARPFFLWVHLIDPHGPYTAPEEPDRYVGDAHARPGRRQLALGAGNAGFNEIPKYQILNGNRDPDYYIARYDAEIRYADEALGEFFGTLRQLGLYDETVIAITADHGETLDEPTHRRYFSHGLIAYEEVSRVPLIVHEPPVRRRLAAVDTSRPAMSVDLAPTLLDVLGVEIPAEFEGRSMLREPRPPDALVFSLGSYGTPRVEQLMGTQLSVRHGPWRYIRNTIDAVEELYDHSDDPTEARDVSAQRADRLSELRSVLATHMAAPGTQNPASAVSAEEQERLRALGYVR